jgi:signal transduction histidine kinase/CheY-like chemotaxis protein
MAKTRPACQLLEMRAVQTRGGHRCTVGRSRGGGTRSTPLAAWHNRVFMVLPTDDAASADPAGIPDTAPEISTRVLSVFFQYFEHVYGHDRTEAVFARIGGEPTLGYVLDPENFVSLEYCVRAAKALSEASGDPGFIRKAGLHQLSSPSYLGFAFYLMRSLGSPRQYYRLANKMTPTYNRVAESRIEKLTDTFLRLRYRSVRPEGTRLLCEGRLGQLAAAPTLWGLPPAEAEEIECQNRGAPACIYELRWAPTTTPLIHALAGGAVGALAGAIAIGAPGAAVGGLIGAAFGAALGYRAQSIKQRRHLLDAAEASARSLDALRNRFQDVQRLHQQAERSHEALGREVRQRERAEAALVDSQRLEALGRLSGGVAHDFNNTLTVVLNTADYLKVRTTDRQELVAGLDAIRAAALRGAALTRQLLTFARTQVAEPRVVRIEAQIESLKPILSRLVGEDVRIQIDLCTSPSFVVIDPGQLERVIMNLTVNARDAMPRGGSLTIATRQVDLDADQSLGLAAGPYAELCVSDNGHGMDEATRARVFEPFFTTKGPGEGTGLGLATSYGIVRQAEGAITVESTRGRGTTFRIYLPRVKEAPDEPPAEPPVSRRGNETVLVVDDEPTVRAIVTRALGEAGYRVLDAANGEEALRRSDAQPGEVHLLVSDVVMSGMDGLVLSKRLREKRPNMRSLFISGYPTDVLTRRGALPADVHLLGKPFSDDELTAKVRAVLDAGGVDRAPRRKDS